MVGADHAVLADIADPANAWDDSLRFFFNRRSAGRSRAVDPRMGRPRPADHPAPRDRAGTRIGLGFDGSPSLDSTVLRACTADGYAFSLPGWAWVRPRSDEMRAWRWRIRPRTDRPRAAKSRQRWQRRSVASASGSRPDAAFWRDEITRWQRLYGDEVVKPFDTNSARVMSPAFDRWKVAVATGAPHHDGDPVVSEHVKAMHQAHPAAPCGDDGRVPLGR